VRMVRCPTAALSLALVVCLATACGPNGTGNDEPDTDTVAPHIADLVASPTSLDIAGGGVSFSARVSDESGLYSVFFRVTDPWDATTDVSGTEGEGDSYTAAFDAPSNSEESVAVYHVQVVAYDNADNVGESPAVQFEVAALVPPPLPPQG